MNEGRGIFGIDRYPRESKEQMKAEHERDNKLLREGKIGLWEAMCRMDAQHLRGLGISNLTDEEYVAMRLREEEEEEEEQKRNPKYTVSIRIASPKEIEWHRKQNTPEGKERRALIAKNMEEWKRKRNAYLAEEERKKKEASQKENSKESSKEQ